MTDPTPPAPERHEERKNKPNWDTKQRCTCGYESVSRAEQWKHEADALRTHNDALTAKLAAAEAQAAEASEDARTWYDRVARLEAERDHYLAEAKKNASLHVAAEARVAELEAGDEHDS